MVSSNPKWILGVSRSGTTYLCELLNQLGYNPRFEEKLVLPDKVSDPLIYHHSKLIAGWQEYLSDEWSSFVDKHWPGLTYVYLRRDDILARAASHYIASQTNVFHIRKDKPDHVHPIDIDLGTLLIYYRIAAKTDHSWSGFLSSRPHIAITYEELIGNTAQTLRKICDFWGTKINLDVAHAAVQKCPLLPTTRLENEVCIQMLRDWIAAGKPDVKPKNDPTLPPPVVYVKPVKR